MPKENPFITNDIKFTVLHCGDHRAKISKYDQEMSPKKFFTEAVRTNMTMTTYKLIIKVPTVSLN